jgi:hypothetical protein
MFRNKLTNMKQLLMALSLITVGASSGQAECLSYESFSGYKADTKLNEQTSPAVKGYTGDWVHASTSLGTQDILAQSAGLSYEGLSTTGGSAGVPASTTPSETDATNSGRVARRLDSMISATDADNKVLYISFLFQSDAQGPTTYQMLGLYNGIENTNNDAFRVFELGSATIGGLTGTEYSYGVRNQYAALSARVTLNAGTHLFIAKFTLKSAPQSDSVQVWIDPTAESSPSVITSGTDLTWDTLTLSDYDGNSASYDEIRWGTDFNSVTPRSSAGAALREAEPATSQQTLENDQIRALVRPGGTLESLELKGAAGIEAVKFRKDVLSGPAWTDVKMTKGEGCSFSGTQDHVRHTVQYDLDGARLLVRVGLKNEGQQAYHPKEARLVLGIDCAMVKYPDWNENYFPTLLRCEKTHFWGYFMTPRGKILTVGCKEPVASYHLNYDASVRGQGDGEHLIHSASLDFLHALPLPPRHPQDLISLAPGQERQWTLVLEPASTLEEVKPQLARSIGAPMLEIDRQTVAAGETAQLRVWSASPVSATWEKPNGQEETLRFKAAAPGQWVSQLAPGVEPGLYTIEVVNASQHRSEASLAVRQPWSWYMNQARKESLRHPQYASSHLEQWLGLTTGALTRRHLPDPELDKQTDQRLREILNSQWDLEKKTVKNIPHGYRYFANTAQMAGLLAQRYMADKDPYWLNLASGFADYCIRFQLPDGNLSNYTSVFYPAKSILLVAQAEKNVPGYQEAYARHYQLVRKAMNYLFVSKDNVVTEGQQTFEDCMIASSGMQKGLFALLQTDPEERKKYADGSRDMMIAHRCLEQLLIPDARMNGATLRFWEAQYDTLIGKARNMMNSPHGWSAWTIPGLWYQYLLTGDEEWLRKTMNAMGSCAQLIDNKTGELRWGFVPDPYREVTMLEPNPENPKRGKRVERTIGESYIPMIAAFHSPDQEPISGNSPDVGWTCCNDVHEIFIAMEEVALTSAYVIEREDGSWSTYNCKATVDNKGVLTVQPAESVVTRVHLNLRKPRKVLTRFANSPVVAATAGMQWIGPGGVPEILR